MFVVLRLPEGYEGRASRMDGRIYDLGTVLPKYCEWGPVRFVRTEHHEQTKYGPVRVYRANREG